MDGGNYVQFVEFIGNICFEHFDYLWMYDWA